jgi:hypothetical protein
MRAACCTKCLPESRYIRGADLADTLAAVLRGEPDWAAVPHRVLPPVRTLLVRCLNKNRLTELRDFSIVNVRRALSLFSLPVRAPFSSSDSIPIS